jgi:hypothetical protein
VDYLYLLKLEQLGKEEYLFEGAEKEYQVDALLEGIEVRPHKTQRSQKVDITGEVNERHTTLRVIVLSTMLGLVLIAFTSTLAVISTYVNATAFAAITTVGLLFSVLLITMLMAATGVIKEKGLTQILDLVLRKVPRVGGTGRGSQSDDLVGAHTPANSRTQPKGAKLSSNSKRLSPRDGSPRVHVKPAKPRTNSTLG